MLNIQKPFGSEIEHEVKSGIYSLLLAKGFSDLIDKPNDQDILMVEGDQQGGFIVCENQDALHQQFNAEIDERKALAETSEKTNEVDKVEQLLERVSELEGNVECIMSELSDIRDELEILTA